MEGVVYQKVFDFLLFPLCFCHALVNRQAISRSISHQLHKFHSLHSLTAAIVLHLLKPKQKKVRNSETLRDLLALVLNQSKRRRIGILPELGTIPVATTSEGPKSEAEE
jgi:hypothetical protein